MVFQREILGVLEYWPAGPAGMLISEPPVAPHAGAWIETPLHLSGRYSGLVAPHAGAWIETAGFYHLGDEPSVAPHAGAWIETCLAEGSEWSH